MKTDAEIRMAGMQALIGLLGLVETERFLMTVSREAFDYTAHYVQAALTQARYAIDEDGNAICGILLYTQ